MDRLSYLFDATPPFAPGAGWEYSDTNYIVLGMIIEQVAKNSYYDELRKRLLRAVRAEGHGAGRQPHGAGSRAGLCR